MITHPYKTLPQDIERFLISLSKYGQDNHLSIKDLASKIGIPYMTLCKWPYFTKRKNVQMPSAKYIELINKFLLTGIESSKKLQKPIISHVNLTETKSRTQKIKYLLLLLEDELRWFKDNNSATRDIFRKEIDASDIGYISSLLAMINDEENFNRWLKLTTIKFNYFKGRRSQDG